MRQDHALDLEMFRSLSVFFDNYADVVDSSPLLKEDVAAFREALNAIDGKMEAQSVVTTISAGDKATLRTKIAQNIRKCLDKITAQAIKDKNAELQAACSTTLSAMTRGSDFNFAVVAKIELTRILSYANILDKYGLKADFRKELASDISVFDKMKPQMNVERSRSIVLTGSRNDLFKSTNEFIDKVMSESIEMFNVTNPDFVKQFEDVSTGRTPSVSPTRVNILLLNDATEAPFKKGAVIVPELKLSTTTDEDGKLTVKVGGNKEVTIIGRVDGFEPQEVTVSKIIRGRSYDVVIRLKALVSALAATN